MGNAAFNVLDNQAFQIGLSHWDVFREKVKILNRKYNTALNNPIPEATTEDPIVKKYRRETQGY